MVSSISDHKHFHVEQIYNEFIIEGANRNLGHRQLVTDLCGKYGAVLGDLVDLWVFGKAMLLLVR